jgi:hypothetical protein
MLCKRIINKNPFLINSKKFSWFSRVKAHFEAFVQPDGGYDNSAIVDTNTSTFTNMRQFQAYLTKNAYDMSIMNEYDLWPHTNFGTIDNPLLIFSADASWR